MRKISNDLRSQRRSDISHPLPFSDCVLHSRQSGDHGAHEAVVSISTQSDISHVHIYFYQG
jgi:hypothetical protein